MYKRQLLGECSYRVGDQMYDIRPGDVFLFNNTDPHGLVLDEGQSITHLVIHFEPSFIWNSLANDLDSVSYTHLMDIKSGEYRFPPTGPCPFK